MMRYLTVAMAAVRIAAVPAHADSGLAAACTVIQSEIGDCGCAINFLEKRIGLGITEIVFRMWAASAGRLGDRSTAFAQLHAEYGSRALTLASLRYSRFRLEFARVCGPSGENIPLGRAADE